MDTFIPVLKFHLEIGTLYCTCNGKINEFVKSMGENIYDKL